VSGVRHKVAVAVAAGVGLAAAQLFFGIYGEPAAGGWPVFYLLVAPVVALLYYFVIAATLHSAAAWVVACGLGAYVFSAWFARPVLFHGPVAAVAEFGGADNATEREEWLEELIAAGRFGEPGVVPPMLDARAGDTGNVVATNKSDSALVLSVAIVAADRAGSGGWRGCGFSGYAGRGPQEWVELAPGQSAVFELEPKCREIFLNLESHTEFRVGNEAVPVELGWWSTSALVAPQGRAEERASGHAALPSSYDARPFYAVAGTED
jgi:hypothetical protein